jgi:hypothetical protein
MVPACFRALVQQPSGPTGSYSQPQTTFPPNPQRVHALLRRVSSREITLLRTLAGFLFLPRSGFVCTLCHRYHPDRRGLIASEHRVCPLVTSFSPLPIYVTPQHLVLARMHKIGTTYIFWRYKTKAMQDAASEARRIHLLRTPLNKGKKRARASRLGPFLNTCQPSEQRGTRSRHIDFEVRHLLNLVGEIQRTAGTVSLERLPTGRKRGALGSRVGVGGIVPPRENRVV